MAICALFLYQHALLRYTSWCTHTHTPLYFLHLLLYCNSEPMGQSGTNEKPVMNDGAFEGYLKLVEGMHAQGKASFEAEFNVSQVG